MCLFYNLLKGITNIMTTIAANGTESNIQNSLQLCYVPILTMSSFAYYTIQL